MVRFIFAALHIRRFGWQTDDVISLLKTDLCEIDENAAFSLENYARMWEISGFGAWQQDWTMNPNGYAIGRSENADSSEKLADLNEIRRKIALPLVKFTEDTPNGSSVKEITVALYNLLVDFAIPRQLVARSEQERANSPEYAQELAQIWAIVVSCLEQLVAVAGDMKVDIKVYEQMLSLLIREADIGRIPTAINQVVVSDALLLRTSGVENIYLLGANEGEFPKKIVDSGIFSHSELTQLSEVGADILPDFDLSLANENFLFHSVISMPTRRLVVSWSSANMRGEPLYPGSGVEAICSTLQNIEIANFNKTIEKMGLTRSKSADLAEFAPFDVQAVTEQIYGDTLKLSQSRLDSFAKCPLLYTCRYVLNLAEPRDSGLTAADAGNIMHYLLDRYFYNQVRGNRNVEEILHSAAEDLCRCITGAGLERAKSDHVRLYQLIRRQISAARLVIRDINEEESSFVPALTELSLVTSFPLANNKSAVLRGNIDRIDVWRASESESEAYLRVVDYKSGTQKFNEKLMEEGFGLQLPLYLRLLRENSSDLAQQLALPPSVQLNVAGAMYHPTNRPIVLDDSGQSEAEIWTEARKKYAKNGLFVDNVEILNAMGASKPGDRSKSKYSLEELAYLDGKLFDAVSGISGKILHGVAQPEPNSPDGRSPCDYCAYKPMCRYECAQNSDEEDGDE